MDVTRGREFCRLCLEEAAEYDIFEEKISLKIVSLVSVEVAADDNLPCQICRSCRVQLEKFYLFRTKCQSSDAYLRKSFTQEDKTRDSVNFLKLVGEDANEHDYEPASKKVKVSEEVSEEEMEAIEATVQTALLKNGYNGQFMLKVEDTDESGLRKIRVIKENGSVILMKLKMPERTQPKVPEKPLPSTSVQASDVEVVLRKCESIDCVQKKLFRMVARTERTVLSIDERLQGQPGAWSTFEGTTEIGREENSQFYFPISHLSELWRLNNRLMNPDAKAQLTEEMSKIESVNGNKIGGKIFRTVIGKSLLGQICWSGRIKDGQKYVKSEDRIMLSKMKHLVDWLHELVLAREPDTTMTMFQQTIMNIIRKERFKSNKDSSEYTTEIEYVTNDVEDYEEAIDAEAYDSKGEQIIITRG